MKEVELIDRMLLIHNIEKWIHSPQVLYKRDFHKLIVSLVLEVSDAEIVCVLKSK